MGGFHVFTLAGIPVQITLWYGILLLYMARGNLETGVIWAACVTVSILVHEFGHGMLARHFNLSPSIILHGWGGLTQHERAQNDRDDVMIISAGPAAGLVLGLVVYVAWGAFIAVNPEAGHNPTLLYAFNSLIFINVFWSLINLVPLWPLDGGQLFRLLMLRLRRSPAEAERITHIVGLALGVIGALVGYLVWNSLFLTILAGLLAWQNFSRINTASASGPIRSQNIFGEELLREARAALDAGDYREAARICHQIRADSRVSKRSAAKLWEILGIASLELKELEDARDYLTLAPDTDAVLMARTELVLLTKDRAAAGALLDHKNASRLPEMLLTQLRQLRDA